MRFSRKKIGVVGCIFVFFFASYSAVADNNAPPKPDSKDPEVRGIQVEYYCAYDTERWYDGSFSTTKGEDVNAFRYLYCGLCVVENCRFCPTTAEITFAKIGIQIGCANENDPAGCFEREWKKYLDGLKKCREEETTCNSIARVACEQWNTSELSPRK